MNASPILKDNSGVGLLELKYYNKALSRSSPSGKMRFLRHFFMKVNGKLS